MEAQRNLQDIIEYFKRKGTAYRSMHKSVFIGCLLQSEDYKRYGIEYINPSLMYFDEAVVQFNKFIAKMMNLQETEWINIPIYDVANRIKVCGLFIGVITPENEGKLIIEFDEPLKELTKDAISDRFSKYFEDFVMLGAIGDDDWYNFGVAEIVMANCFMAGYTMYCGETRNKIDEYNLNYKILHRTENGMEEW